MMETQLQEERIQTKQGKTIVIIAAESIKRAFKKVKEDINMLKNEILKVKEVQVNQAEVLRNLIEKFDEITNLKKKVSELEAKVEQKNDLLNEETKKILMNLNGKVDYLIQKIAELEKENEKLKEENAILKRIVSRMSERIPKIVEEKGEVY